MDTVDARRDVVAATGVEDGVWAIEAVGLPLLESAPGGRGCGADALAGVCTVEVCRGDGRIRSGPMSIEQLADIVLGV